MTGTDTEPLAYSLERLSPEIEEAFARLFPPEDGKTPELLRWRFEQAPPGPGWIAVTRDAAAGDAIIGVVAVSAANLSVGGREVPAFQAVDLIVDPAYRGRGVFAGLARTLLDGAAAQGAAVVWGFPNDNAAHGWFNRFGWLRFGTAPFMIRPIRTGYFLGRAASFLRKLDVRIVGRSADANAEMVEEFGSEFDGFWAACAGKIGCSVPRDAKTLQWRFKDRPGTAYRNVISRAGDGEVAAFVSTCLLDKHDGRILYVMEAIARPGADGVLTALLRSELARAAAEGADAALAWCPPEASNRRSFRRAGFWPFAERLRPVIIHFGARLLRDDVPATVRQGNRWYVSYFDSDTV